MVKPPVRTPHAGVKVHPVPAPEDVVAMGAVGSTVYEPAVVNVVVATPLPEIVAIV